MQLRFRHRIGLLVALAAPAALASPLAHADEKWPTKPVKILFGFPAASATDVPIESPMVV